VRLAVLAHKRATLLGLRDQQRIDETVLRQVQARLTWKRSVCPGRRRSTDRLLSPVAARPASVGGPPTCWAAPSLSPSCGHDRADGAFSWLSRGSGPQSVRKKSARRSVPAVQPHRYPCHNCCSTDGFGVSQSRSKTPATFRFNV
jgi:hypothetical protein